MKNVPERYRLIAMCFGASFICYIDRVNVSVAAIAMAADLGLSTSEKGLVLSSFFLGYLLAQIPSGLAASIFGGRLVMLVALVWWSAFTIITPVAAAVSTAVLIVARIAMGAGEAGAFPAVYALFGKWIPENERSRAIAIMLSGVPIGTVFALLTTGVLVERFGWQSVFYIFGTAGLVFAFFWRLIIKEHPREVTAPNRNEASSPGTAVSLLEPLAQLKFPLHLLRRRAVIALIVNHFCSNWSLYVLLTWLPSYFSDVQKLSLINAGLFSAAPWLAMFASSNGAALLADRMIQKGFGVRRTRKILQISGLMGSAFFLLLATQTLSAGIALGLFCASLGSLGLTWAGYGPNHLDIAPKHAGALVGVTNTAGTLPGVIGVLLTGWLVDVTGTYFSAFALSAAIGVLGSVVWFFWAEGEPIETDPKTETVYT